MRLYYKIANRVAFHIYVKGLEHQDKVQECVIKAWSALGEQPTEDLIPLIYTIMRNHLMSMSKPSYNERKTTYNVDDTAVYSRNTTMIVIPMPSKKVYRVLLVAWLEADGMLNDACHMLGWSYPMGRHYWIGTKNYLAKMGFDTFILEQDQCWLRGYYV